MTKWPLFKPDRISWGFSYEEAEKRVFKGRLVNIATEKTTESYRDEEKTRYFESVPDVERESDVL